MNLSGNHLLLQLIFRVNVSQTKTFWLSIFHNLKVRSLSFMISSHVTESFPCTVAATSYSWLDDTGNVYNSLFITNGNPKALMAHWVKTNLYRIGKTGIWSAIPVHSTSSPTLTYPQYIRYVCSINRWSSYSHTLFSLPVFFQPKSRATKEEKAKL